MKLHTAYGTIGPPTPRFWSVCTTGHGFFETKRNSLNPLERVHSNVILLFQI